MPRPHVLLVLFATAALLGCDPDGLRPIGDSPVEDGLPSEGQLRDQADPAAEDGDDPTGEDPTGEDPAGEDPTGEDPTGDPPDEEDGEEDPPPPPPPAEDPPGTVPVETWSFSFGSPSFDQAKDVAVDADGNVYVTGSFRDTATFGDVTLTAEVPDDHDGTSASDIVLFSLAPDGALRWAKRFGGDPHDEGKAVTTDAWGNVYLFANIQSPTDFGGGAIMSDPEGTDMALASFTTDGDHRWSTAFGGPGMDLAFDVAASHNRVCASGAFDGDVYIGPGVPVLHAFSIWGIDALLACYDLDGTPVWATSFGAEFNDSGTAVAIAADGNVWLGADFETIGGPIDPGDGAVDGEGDWDSLLVGYDASGALLGSRHLGTSGDEGIIGLGTDPAGNPIAAGIYGDTAQFGGPPLAHADQHDSFLLSTDADLEHRWSVGFGGEGFDQALGLAVDAFGNSFVTGRYDDTLDIEDETLQAAGDYDVFVGSWDRFGALRWARSFGGHKYDQAMGIAAGPDGVVYVVGFFREHTAFAGPLVSQGDSDGFVLRIDQGVGE